MSCWPRVPLGDLVIGGRPQRSDSDEPVWNLNLDQIEPDTGRVLQRVRVPQDDLGPSTYPFVPGTVLYSKLRPYLNKVVVADEPGFATTELVPLCCKPQKAVPSYIAYFLRSAEFLSFANTVVAGAKMPRMVMSEFWKYQVPLPPLDAQRRIAAILDKADALRSKRREALAQLDRLAQSIFVEMFGDPVRNPKAWPLRSFNDVCPTRLGKMLDQKQQTGQHNRKYLRNANVRWFRFDLSDILEMDFDEAARAIFALEDGDLLICEGGEPGRAAIWRSQIPECYYQKALHRGRPDHTLAHSEYLVWLLWGLAQGGGLNDHVTSATIAHLTGEKLKAMQIPLPPLPLQSQFVQRLNAQEQLRLTEERASKEQQALFVSLQQRAFAGEI